MGCPGKVIELLFLLYGKCLEFKVNFRHATVSHLHIEFVEDDKQKDCNTLVRHLMTIKRKLIVIWPFFSIGI